MEKHPFGDPKDDSATLGLATLLGLCDALAANRLLQSVCSDGNSSVHDVARDLAITVLDYIKKCSVTQDQR